jgi:hypothetical protein
MILSTIKLNKTGFPIIRQKVIINCDQCHLDHIFPRYYTYAEGKEKYGIDLCLSCRRQKQYINAGKSSIKRTQGKTYEEIFGNEKGNKIRNNISVSLSGSDNPMYGRNNQCSGIIQYAIDGKGLSFDKRYGKEKSQKIKDKISIHSSGENNPMYGKPSPIGSGNGWSGWYKGWYFRSLHELSYMINAIERFGFKWESAEKKELKIPYIGFNKEKRTYVADFIINEKYLVEIKPKKLHKSKIVQLKKEAAMEFCKKNGFIYKLTYSSKLLSYLDIKRLVDNKCLQFTERYKEKFNIWVN